MDFTEHRESLLAHYIALAAEPGWKRYVWERVQELARQPHGLYADFPERLTAALTPPPSKEKPDVI